MITSTTDADVYSSMSCYRVFIVYKPPEGAHAYGLLS